MVRKFMEEAELMKKFSHQNIVSLLGIYVVYIINSTAYTMDYIDINSGILKNCFHAGVSTDDGYADSAPLIILEYMPHGDLRGFLIKHRYMDDCGYIYYICQGTPYL